MTSRTDGVFCAGVAGTCVSCSRTKLPWQRQNHRRTVNTSYIDLLEILQTLRTRFYTILHFQEVLCVSTGWLKIRCLAGQNAISRRSIEIFLSNFHDLMGFNRGKFFQLMWTVLLQYGFIFRQDAASAHIRQSWLMTGQPPTAVNLLAKMNGYKNSPDINPLNFRVRGVML